MGSPILQKVWSVLLAEQATSGLSVVEFCRRRGVTRESYYRWRRKLKPGESSCESQVAEPHVAEFLTTITGQPEERQQQDLFVPLTVVEPDSVGHAGIELEMPCGATLRLPDGNEQLLRQVLGILLDREVVQP